MQHTYIPDFLEFCTKHHPHMKNIKILSHKKELTLKKINSNMSIKSDKCKRFTRAPPTRVTQYSKNEENHVIMLIIMCKLSFCTISERIKSIFWQLFSVFLVKVSPKIAIFEVISAQCVQVGVIGRHPVNHQAGGHNCSFS